MNFESKSNRAYVFCVKKKKLRVGNLLFVASKVADDDVLTIGVNVLADGVDDDDDNCDDCFTHKDLCDSILSWCRMTASG